VETIAISKFKATCLALLEKVKKTGNPLLITKKGKPIACVVPPPKQKQSKSWIGCMSDKGKIIGDIVGPVFSEDDREAVH